MIKAEVKIGDWCYVFGDDVFVQISKIEYDSNNNVKYVYAISTIDGIFVDRSLSWICGKNEEPEEIFQELSYEELEERMIN